MSCSESIRMYHTPFIHKLMFGSQQNFEKTHHHHHHHHKTFHVQRKIRGKKRMQKLLMHKKLSQNEKEEPRGLCLMSCGNLGTHDIQHFHHRFIHTCSQKDYWLIFHIYYQQQKETNCSKNFPRISMFVWSLLWLLLYLNMICIFWIMTPQESMERILMSSDIKVPKEQ